jgi:hypothetical protein
MAKKTVDRDFLSGRVGLQWFGKCVDVGIFWGEFKIALPQRPLLIRDRL